MVPLNFGKDVVSKCSTGGGNVADIGVQGNAPERLCAQHTLNPFIDQQTRQKNEQDIAARARRNARFTTIWQMYLAIN